MARAFLQRMENPTAIAAEAEAEAEAAPVSFDEFFLAERDGLHGALWLVTRNRYEAEEIAQDAFLKVWERWGRVEAMADPSGYLYRTAMNLWRSRGRRAALSLRKVVHAAPPEDDMRAVEERDVVMRALSGLTPRQRAAIVLVDLLGLTSDAAGRALGVRPSTVRVLAARARTVMREGMEER
jgi:RNA polymerase sigma-70 factor (ECF subfamily)